MATDEYIAQPATAMGWRLALLAGWVDTPVLLRFQAFERRNEFGPVYLLSFLAVAYTMAWLLIADAIGSTPTRVLTTLTHALGLGGTDDLGDRN